jgi:hypothetical protein
MTTNPYLDVHAEVADALADRRPVVALESTIISHGMPYPQNVETALRVEAEVRAQGAVPATIAIVDGRLKAGLSAAHITRLGQDGAAVPKVSRRDLPFIVARGGLGATTVAATMMVAAMAGIRVFATGGIGGVHRGAAQSFDVSADLQELARSQVAVVCAGAKAILDLRLTLEYLETHGVPVVGYRTDRLPRSTPHKASFRSTTGLTMRWPSRASCTPSGRWAWPVAWWWPTRCPRPMPCPGTGWTRRLHRPCGGRRTGHWRQAVDPFPAGPGGRIDGWRQPGHEHRSWCSTTPGWRQEVAVHFQQLGGYDADTAGRHASCL